MHIGIGHGRKGWANSVTTESDTRVCLRRQTNSFVIAADAWRELLDLAWKMGWRPAYELARYRTGSGLSVSTLDAHRLSLAFEELCGYLAKHRFRYAQDDFSQLINGLSHLAEFCDGGEFCVCSHA